MKLRNICLSVFGVIIVSLMVLSSGLCTVIKTDDGDDVLSIPGLDPLDMSIYHSMGEYYPPDIIDTINVNWVGGRVEIIGYNESSYFVEEAATRQLMENERLSCDIRNNSFTIFYTESDETVIDDAFKKVEIRVPKQLSKKLNSINVNSNGEVILKNLTAENITINNINSSILLESAYSKNTNIETIGGNISLAVDSEVGYSIDYDSKIGKLSSYIDNGKNQYICGAGTYPYAIKSRSGNLIIKLKDLYYNEK